VQIFHNIKHPELLIIGIISPNQSLYRKMQLFVAITGKAAKIAEPGAAH